MVKPTSEVPLRKRTATAFTRNTVEKVMDLLDVIDRRTERLDLILMLRDPGSTAAADAYEGLRKQVIAGANERMAHLNQLVQFEVAVKGGASADDLLRLVAEWMQQAGVERIDDIKHPDANDLFEVLGDDGDAYLVRQPAYRDALTSRLLRLGRVEFVRLADLPPGSAPSVPTAQRSDAEQPPAADPPRSDS